MMQYVLCTFVLLQLAVWWSHWPRPYVVKYNWSQLWSV